MRERKPVVILGETQKVTDPMLKQTLEQKGVSVWHCRDGITAIRRSYEINPDMIILDAKLSRLNGFQCSRLLKNDPQMLSVPIIHIGSSHNPMEQYWSRICRADAFLNKPVRENDLNRIIKEFVQPENPSSQLLPPSSIIPDLEDHSILSMAVNLLEQDLFRLNVLNEINMLEVSSMPAHDIVAAAMAIIGSLYTFTSGIALLFFEHQGEFFFYTSYRMEQDRIDHIKHLIVGHLRDQHQYYLDLKQTKETVLEGGETRPNKPQTDTVYIHTRESGPIRSALAFENLNMEDMTKDDQDILMLTLDLVHGVMEKKVFFRTSHQLSIIDATTEGYSMLFFMGVLKREIENAKRYGYPMTLLTIAVSNFKEITRNLNPDRKNALIRTIHKLIMKAMRKSDIVARWESAAFAFLFTHTPLEKARIAQERISDYLLKQIKKYLPASARVQIGKGGSQFDPDRDLSPESYFSNAKPSKIVKG